MPVVESTAVAVVMAHAVLHHVVALTIHARPTGGVVRADVGTRIRNTESSYSTSFSMNSGF